VQSLVAGSIAFDQLFQAPLVTLVYREAHFAMSDRSLIQSLM